MGIVVEIQEGRVGGQQVIAYTRLRVLHRRHRVVELDENLIGMSGTLRMLKKLLFVFVREKGHGDQENKHEGEAKIGSAEAECSRQSPRFSVHGCLRRRLWGRLWGRLNRLLN